MASREITFSVHDIPEVQEMFAALVDERDEARTALAERDATIARVRELHFAYRSATVLDDADVCAECTKQGYDVPWPCPTALALDGPP